VQGRSAELEGQPPRQTLAASMPNYWCREADEPVAQLRHCSPVSDSGGSFQFGRASALTIPQRVHHDRQDA
jgi:hypothetical protein